MYDLTKMFEEIVEDEKFSKSRNRKLSQKEITKLLQERLTFVDQQENLSQVPLGKVLIRDGLITKEQLEEALQLQTERGGKIGSILVQMGYIEDQMLLKSLSRKYDTESVSLLDVQIGQDVLNLVPYRIVEHHRVLPIKVEGKNLYLAMETPNDFSAIHEVEMLAGKKVHPTITTAYQMDLAIDYLAEKGGGNFDGYEIQQLMKGPMTIVSLLDVAAKHKAADLLVSVGSPPALRKNGQLYTLDMPPTTKGIGEVYAKVLMTEQQWSAFQEQRQITFISDHKSTGRLRVSAYLQRSGVSLSIRRVACENLQLEALGLPARLESYVRKREGLIVVAAASGHGKTTSVMALAESVNRSRAANIMGIHDCLEYTLSPKKSLINQREIGKDIHSFKSVLDGMSRQSVDVLVLDEMHGAHAVDAALTAASSGHLVLASILSPTATRAIKKMVGFFPPDRHAEVRGRIADCLLLVLAQKLVARDDGKDARPLLDRLVADDLVKDAINRNDFDRLEQGCMPGKEKSAPSGSRPAPSPVEKIRSIAGSGEG